MNTDNTPEQTDSTGSADNNKICSGDSGHSTSQTVPKEMPFVVYLLVAFLGYLFIMLPSSLYGASTHKVLFSSVLFFSAPVSILATAGILRNKSPWVFAIVLSTIAHLIVVPVALVASFLVYCAAR